MSRVMSARVGTRKSGWCIDAQQMSEIGELSFARTLHERCPRPECTCECHALCSTCNAQRRSHDSSHVFTRGDL